MAVPLQARSRYFSRLADAKLEEYLLQAHAMPLSSAHNSYSLCNNTEVCYNKKYDFYEVEK